MRIQDLKCIGGPLDGQWLAIDRDQIAYLPTDPEPPLGHTLATYTVRKERETGEWFLVWDGDKELDANPTG